MTTHIGIDARLTYYRSAGTSAYIRALLTAFDAHPAPDQTFTVIQSRKQVERLAPTLRHVKAWTPSHHRLEKWALSVELARLRLDVLHSPDFIPPVRGARKHVISVLDLGFLHYPDILTPESRRYYSDQIGWAVERADHILAISQATKRDLVTMLNVPPEKITVHLLAAHKRFKPLPIETVQPVLSKFGLNLGYLLFVSTIEPRKNIPMLLDAYSEFRRKVKDAPKLVLVGRIGWLVEETLALIQNTPGVLHIENAADDDLPSLYNGAAALLAPSLYEGFGLSPLEAMACGTLPIVSDRASLPEVVGEVGLQINPYERDEWVEAMRTVISPDNGAWIARQRAAALERAASFTWARTAHIAREVYRQVAKT